MRQPFPHHPAPAGLVMQTQSHAFASCSTLWAFAKLETYHKELFDLGEFLVHACYSSQGHTGRGSLQVACVAQGI